MAAVRSDVRVLAKVVERLHDMLDTSEDSRCAVAAEHKEAFASYLTTWVLPYVEAVLADLDGTEPLPGWMRT